MVSIFSKKAFLNYGMYIVFFRHNAIAHNAMLLLNRLQYSINVTYALGSHEV